MRKLSKFVLVAGFIGATVASAAEIYKCPNAAGKIEYRDRPCDGAVGQKITPKDNSVGNGEGIEGVRAKAAALKARQDARREADDKAAAENYQAAERAYNQERSHRASEDLAAAIREGNNQRAADYYNSRLVPQPYDAPYRAAPQPATPAPKKK